MYSCWIYPDVLMLDISGCTRVGYIRMYSYWIYPDVLVLDVFGYMYVVTHTHSHMHTHYFQLINIVYDVSNAFQLE